MNRRTFLGAMIAPTFLPAQHSEPVALYTVGSWPVHYGNHRARLRVSGAPGRVQAHIPWRRHDNPEQKAILVVEAASGRTVEPVEVFTLTRDACDLCFHAPAPGEYHVYYMPCRATTVPHAWRTEYARTSSHRSATPAVECPKARLLDIQARTEFDRFDPMEIAATDAETEELIRSRGNPPFLVFAEHRQHPIRMTRRLPVRWVNAAPMPSQLILAVKNHTEELARKVIKVDWSQPARLALWVQNGRVRSALTKQVPGLVSTTAAG